MCVYKLIIYIHTYNNRHSYILRVYTARNQGDQCTAMMMISNRC